MTVFCTACGKPNTEEAEKCASCGHQLKSSEPSSKKKFKGTMMMGAGGMQPPGPAAAQPPPDPEAPPAQNAPKLHKGTMMMGAEGLQPPPPNSPADAPQGTPDAAGSAASKKNLAFQKTMMGPAGGMSELLKQQQQNTPEDPGDAATDVDQGKPPSSSISQPPGGFGPPAQSSSGFGAPVGGSSGFGPPAQGAGASESQGGFGPPSQTGPVDTSDIPSGPPSGSFGGGDGGGSKSNTMKYLLFGGIGCLVLLLLVCLIGGWMAYSSMKEAVEEAQLQMEESNGLGAGVQGELARLDLSASLSSLQMICDMDRSAEGARSTFHPDVFESLRGEACRVDRSTVVAFSDSANSKVAPGSSELPGTSDCYAFISGGASITTCKFEGNTVITAMQGVDQVR